MQKKERERKECKKEMIKRQSLCVYRSNHTHAHIYNICVCVRVCVCIQKVRAHIGLIMFSTTNFRSPILTSIDSLGPKFLFNSQ